MSFAKVSQYLGVLAQQVKQPVVGLSLSKAAVEAKPNHEQYSRSYIGVLIQADQMAVARKVLVQDR